MLPFGVPLEQALSATILGGVLVSQGLRLYSSVLAFYGTMTAWFCSYLIKRDPGTLVAGSHIM